MHSILLTLFLIALATPALATDGVLEINQTCAAQTGCFSGDAAGYPVTIDGSAGRSYRLTSDLTVPDENADGIVVSTSDVGIDLNNFAIIRSGCEGATVDCTPTSGTGSGVARTSSLVSGVSVKNGSVTGMGSYGVFLGNQAEVTNLRVRWNRLEGINANIGSSVSGSTAYQNGRSGIEASVGSTFSGNTAYQNGNDGIVASSGSTVSGNTAYQNEGRGVSAGTGSTVSGNTAYANAGDGIDCGAGCTVIGNAAYANGNTAGPTDDDGIACSSGCLVRDNSVRNNGGYGLNLGPNSAYGANVVTGNATGTVSGGFNILLNVCDGPSAPQCP